MGSDFRWFLSVLVLVYVLGVVMAISWGWAIKLARIIGGCA